MIPRNLVYRQKEKKKSEAVNLQYVLSVLMELFSVINVPRKEKQLNLGFKELFPDETKYALGFEF